MSTISGIQVQVVGAEVTPAQAAVLDDIGEVMAAIHAARQKPDDPTPSLAEAASGLIGLLATRNWRESDIEAYASIASLAALLLMDSSSTTVTPIPAKSHQH